MKSFLKWIGYLLSFIFVLLFLIIYLLKIKRLAKKYLKRPQDVLLKYRQKVIYKLFRIVIYLFRIKIIDEGFDHLSSNKQYLFIPNHKSNWDPMILYITLYKKNKLPPLSFVAKMELSKKWYSKWILVLADVIPLQRNNGRSIFECYLKQTENIKKSYSICVFPEGTRVPGDIFKDFKTTTLKVAFDNFITIVPVTIYGCDLKNHKTSIKKFHHDVYISILKPIQPNDFITTKHQLLMPIIQKKIIDKYFELKIKASL